jgi:DNA-binding SARP family transcriptional activator/TolB-like protein
MLRLRTLGRLELDGAPAPTARALLQGPKRLGLLAYLACAQPAGLKRRDTLLALFWPELDDSRARHALRNTLHSLRSTLGADLFSSAGAEAVGIPDGMLTCDAAEFERALAEDRLEDAVALYEGDFLAGFFVPDSHEFEEWMEGERQRLRRAHHQALERLAEAAGERQDWTQAVEWWRQVAEVQPQNGRLTRRLMEAMVAGGDRAGALNQAQHHAEVLRQEFDADPDPEVRELAERIRAGEATSAGRSSPVPPAVSEGESNDVIARPTGGQADSNRQSSVIGAAVSMTPEAGVPVARRPAPRWARALGAAAALLLFGTVAWVSVLRFRQSDVVSSIAVLPLANLTGDPNKQYFVAGMHDALISELARIQSLTVLSRQSVLRYDGSDVPLSRVARELGVDAIAEGAVFESGDSVRISVQLVRVHPEAHLLSASFTGPLDHAMSLQGEVARAVAGAVRAQLRPEVQARMERSRALDPAAQEAYLSGLYHLERGSYGEVIPRSEMENHQQQAIADLERAVALDSAWAAAYGKLALAYHWAASSGGHADADTYYPKARAAALRAIALDSTEAQAYASLGFVLYRYDWDWAGAERAIRRAIELDPNSHHWIYALYLSAAGRHDEAIAQYHMAEERDPLSDLLKAQVASEYACAGRYEEAITQVRQLHARARVAAPAGLPGDSLWLLRANSSLFALAGMPDSAVNSAERLLAATDTLSSGDHLAFAYAMAGRRDEARALFERVRAMGTTDDQAWQAPEIYAAMGDTANAVAAAEGLFQRLGRDVTHVRCWPMFTILRGASQVEALLEPIGFPQ